MSLRIQTCPKKGIAPLFLSWGWDVLTINPILGVWILRVCFAVVCVCVFFRRCENVSERVMTCFTIDIFVFNICLYIYIIIFIYLKIYNLHCLLFILFCIMEVEHVRFWRLTTSSSRAPAFRTFHFHDYGRKGTKWPVITSYKWSYRLGGGFKYFLFSTPGWGRCPI